MAPNRRVPCLLPPFSSHTLSPPVRLGAKMTRRDQKVSKKFLAFLLDSLGQFQLALADSTAQDSLVLQAPAVGSLKQAKSWKNLVSEGLRALGNVQELTPLHDELWDVLTIHLSRWLGENRPVDHQDKRSLARKLDLLRKPYSVNEILSNTPSFEEGSKRLYDEYGVKLVLRERDQDHGYKQHRTLVEDPAYAKGDKTILCGIDQGFLHVDPEESVIFVSQQDDPLQPFKIELVVIRDALAESEFTKPLLDWITATVCMATCNRRNVRPTHPGVMVQIGINMGPRHAKVLGYAKSFTRKLSAEQMAAQDTDLIGAISLLWNLARAYLPEEVIAEITAFLDSVDYPPLATRNIPAGTDFTITYQDKAYTFASAGRAPPEGIATWAFHMPTHKDHSPLKWSLAITSMREVYSDSPLNPKFGSNLVDLSLRVVVQSRVGTLTAFNPNELHGTTTHGRGIDPVNAGVSLTSTRRVYTAYTEMMEKGPVIFAGEPVDVSKHDH
ncbi:hypothetical protein NMY22_g16778 [Coprinellus aureogranulatus]|nr:hypothetical protein NMY22_g16778 [Coprinellus aureogranulatus]